MPIASAVEHGAVIYIYDENGLQISSIPGSSEPGDGLKGYTSSTVSVKRGGIIFIYNEHGMQISSVPAS
jgi:hypothetical protein